MISKFTYRNRLPKCIILLCLFSFVMSILWIWAIANILVDILKTIGVIYPIPPTFLAMTLLSVGNSLPDLNLNCALAKSGYGEMGIAGSIAGPLFNLLIGLGTSLIIKTYENGVIEFYFFDAASQTIVIAGCVLGLNLIRLLIQSIILKFYMSKSVSYIGYSFYVIFIVGITVFTFFPL
jgi:sodium/potassium/calcium exchanger 6